MERAEAEHAAAVERDEVKGDFDEKTGPWHDSFVDNLEPIFGAGMVAGLRTRMGNKPNDILRNFGMEPLKLGYSRGRSISNALIIIDEAQRIRHEQFEALVSYVTLRSCILIFSFDASQTLSRKESNDYIAGKIGAIASKFCYKLSTKIRTNKEISDFTALFFNNREIAKVNKSENIKINFFNDLGDAKSYLLGLQNSGWEVLKFTPSQFKVEHHQKYYPFWVKTSHEVIGQEFDSVAIAVDNFFKYNANGDLFYSGNAYYESAKMLYQNITRARRRLNLVIIANQEVLHRCLSILD
jgi:hypothetical protein